MSNDGGKGGVLPFPTLAILYQMLAILTLYEMIDVLDTVFAFICLPGMFRQIYILN